MDKLISSIREAVDKDCIIPALFTALTVPDAMGQCLYPELKHKNGGRDIGAQYAAWFDEWVKGDFFFPASSMVGGQEVHVLNGKMCYDLRCSLLHSGDYDVPVPTDDKPEEDGGFTLSYHFELRMHACNGLVATWVTPSPEDQAPTRDVDFIVDAGSLALAICDGAERCLNETRFTSKEPYPELSIVDLKEWKEKISPR